MIEKTEIDKGFKYYNLDRKYINRCYECADIINNNAQYLELFNKMFMVLNYEDFDNIRPYWNIKNIDEIFGENVDDFVTNLIIVLSYKNHEENMKEFLEKCELCPRKCKINRYETLGFCKAQDKIKVAHIALHKFEEPCIINKNGSGTIFFSGCNLRCCFCQNYKISMEGYGIEISSQELAEKMLKLQNMCADNINLVSPTIYAIQIKEAIKIAKEKGLNIPIIYNTNGYENVETLKMLEGYIDVYLPDFKYATSFMSEKYSLAKDYPIVAKNAIKECLRQVPNNIYDENGKILKGVIIRHLVLPNHLLNTKNVLNIIQSEYGKDVSVSIMAQYFPTYKAIEIEKLNRKITKKEYDKVIGFIEELELSNGYIQELEDNEEKYVPLFDLRTLE